MYYSSFIKNLKNKTNTTENTVASGKQKSIKAITNISGLIMKIRHAGLRPPEGDTCFETCLAPLSSLL